MTTIRVQRKQTGTALLVAGCSLIGLFHGETQAQEHRFQATNICEQTATELAKACRFEVQDSAKVATANCLNLLDPQAAADCKLAVNAARTEGNTQCAVVEDAREDVCDNLGGGAYDPVIDPANFVAGINNRYTPFPTGAFRVYEKLTPEGLTRIRIDVLPETRQIMGVTMTTLRDVVTLDGVMIEDTLDWLAQDVQGNVWYFGELVQNFEDGILRDLDGSFEAGRNGDKAGFWSTAFPQVGDFYRQEWSLGNAEDVVEVMSLDARDEIVPFSSHGTGPVLKIKATTPMSPVVEFKYYVPGIGFALEVKPATGERLELVDYGPR